MEILLRSARIIDTGSTFHKQTKDILISNGVIKKIGARLSGSSKTKEVRADNLHVSIGWFDMNAFLADPGFEQKETIETGCRAAAAGGFTHICCMPNTHPVLQTKSQIEYVRRKSAGEVVEVHPVGAATQDVKGRDLAEMYDMRQAGAVAFSDGMVPSAPAGTLERALLYVKAFDGLVMVHPEDKTISGNGVMNEGPVSIRIGLPGIPALAEEVAVNRDLYLLDYTASRLHFLDISLKKSVELIRAAKKKGLRVTASVNAYNLMLDENAVGNYDTDMKVNPPLRSKEDITALIRGIADGTIDSISSAHHPQDEECKKLEFDKADFGMIGLETCYAVANTCLKKHISTEQLVEIFSMNPRAILGIPAPAIEEGADADLTLFDPDKKWTFTEKDIRSRSRNTPFAGTEFIGKVLGVINKNQLVTN